MLFDFLYDCQCALINEKSDFQETLREFANKFVCVGFMPAVTDDLYPVFALSCTSAKQVVSPNVYIIPVGAHNYWAKPYFEEIINKFYQEDTFREQFDIELEEILLLVNPRLNCSFSLCDGINCNVVFCHITLPNGMDNYLVIVPERPEVCWEKVVESYEIKCDIVIDSHKGMGDWFDDVPLYRIMSQTHFKELLPRYYFKGRYISQDAPCGFKLLYTIPEKISTNGRYVGDGEKEIYETDWNENTKICGK